MSNKEIGLLIGAFAVVALLVGGVYAITLASQPAPAAPPQIVYRTAPAVQAAATSPGTGGGITSATNLARECIIDLYGGVANVPRRGVAQASVDDTIAQCVKARGGQIVTGGQCDASSTDGCSNTFADTGQDPDSDPVAIIFDVLDASGVVIGDLFVTQGAQVLGSSAGGNCIPSGECLEDKTGVCLADKPCINNGRCQAICPEGEKPGAEPSCQKQVVDSCRVLLPVACEMVNCIRLGLARCLGRDVSTRECPIIHEPGI